MEKPITTAEYFRMPESNRPAELVYGVVSEPPAPLYGHQKVVGQLFHLLKTHVEQHRLGEVCISPIDVVLDEGAALVVQPDIIFVSRDRSSIIRGCIIGAPDIVIEVASPGTEYRDRTVKLAWYQRYGVRECWIANPHTRTIDIVDCVSGAVESFADTHALRSRVLPQLTPSADDCFR